MRHHWRPLIAVLACSTAAGAVASAPPYAVTTQIPGTDGGWDYASVDPSSARFFVAHGDTVGVIDLAHPTVVKQLGEAHHAHAVLPIPGTRELLVTDGDTATVRLVDQKTGMARATLTVGEKPDAAAWDARRKQAVVMSSKAGTIEFIEPVTARITATVQLAPNLEAAAFDRTGRLFVNNEAQNSVYIVDPDTAKVIGTISLAGCEKPTGMAYAPKANRIVSACSNGIATIIDPDEGTLVATIPIGPGPDAVIADAARNRLMIPSGGDGTLAILDDRATGLAKITTIKTEVGARTGAVDPRTGIIYLPSAHLGVPDKPGGRGQPLPGTFHILVVTPARSAS